MVRVTWTAPPAPPFRYLVRFFMGSGVFRTQQRTSTFLQSLINGRYGMYVAQVMSLSQHLPGGTAESEEVAVLGEDY